MGEFKLRTTTRELLYTIGALLLFFQIYLQVPVDYFRFIDEAITVLCLAKIIVAALRKSLDRSHIYMLMLMVLLLCIGLVSNIYAQKQTQVGPILTDVGSTFKVFVTYMGTTLYLRPVSNKKRIVNTLAVIMRIFVVIMFFCMILHELGIVSMGEDVRYGLLSFRFINDGAGQLSFMFYFIFLIFTLDLRYNQHKKTSRLIFMVMASLVWISTLRTRAFMYVLVFWVLFWFLVMRGKMIRLNWKTVLVGVIGMALMSMDQIETYFLNDRTARYNFLHYGLYTMERFFPFGSGFATYGTDAALVYYSQLYYEYGFPGIWGLSPDFPVFTHDTYWPAIIAQFGFFGTLVMLVIIVCWVKDVLKRAGKNRYAYLAALFICITQVSSSIATSTFFHFVTVGIVFLVPLIFDESHISDESRRLDEKSNSLYPNLQPRSGPAPGL